MVKIRIYEEISIDRCLHSNNRVNRIILCLMGKPTLFYIMSYPISFSIHPLQVAMCNSLSYVTSILNSLSNPLLFITLPNPTKIRPSNYLQQTNQYTPIKKHVKPPNLHIIQQVVKERLRHPSNRLIPMSIYSPTPPAPLRFRFKHCSTIRTRYGLHTMYFSSTRSESRI